MAREQSTETGAVGLGTFPLSGVFSDLAGPTAIAVLERFLELGGRYVETAPSYPASRADLAPLLSSVDRGTIYLATKCVTGSDADGNKVRSGKPDWIREQVARSAETLNIDYFDLVQTHITPTDVSPESLMETLQGLVEEGIAREIGCSNVDIYDLRRLTTVGPISWIQNRLSLIHQQAYLEMRELCKETDVRLNPYQVIERGLLVSNRRAPQARREGDLRSSKVEYTGEPFSVIANWVDQELQPIAAAHGTTVESLAIAWALSCDEVECCVIGATSPEQVESNLTAAGLVTDRELIQTVSDAAANLRASIQATYGLSVEAFRGVG